VDMLPTLARRAADYIADRTKTGQPFFLYLPLCAPHAPVVPSKEGSAALAKQVAGAIEAALPKSGDQRQAR